MDASYKLEIFISDHVAAEEVSILEYYFTLGNLVIYCSPYFTRSLLSFSFPSSAF